MKIRVNYFLFIGLTFLCFFSVTLSNTFALDCSGVFRGEQTNIDYDKYMPSVVRITSWLPASISENTVISALNLMSQDKLFGEVVSPIIDRLVKIKQKYPSVYKTTISLFASTITLYKRHPEYLDDLREQLELPEEYQINLKQVIEKITETMGYNMGSCPGVVVSHNAILIAAHCIVGRASTFYYDGEKFIDAKEYFYITDVLASSNGMSSDVGVVVFPDHTFDKIDPLKVGESSASYDKAGVIGVRAEGKDKIKKDVRLVKQRDLFLFQGGIEEFLKEGEFGMFGPLINQEGQLIGLAVGHTNDNKGQIWSLCVDFTTKKIQDFFSQLVREKNVIISGIE